MNIYDGIESTLVMLLHRFREIVSRSTIKLNNAVDAIEERLDSVQQRNGAVTLSSQNLANLSWVQTNQLSLISSPITPFCISTQTGDNTVKISIGDSRSGIFKTLQKPLFEPLLTTKSVGKGSGLCTTISYHIVLHKQKGQLICYYEASEGADFVIEIPVET